MSCGVDTSVTFAILQDGFCGDTCDAVCEAYCPNQCSGACFRFYTLSASSVGQS